MAGFITFAGVPQRIVTVVGEGSVPGPPGPSVVMPTFTMTGPINTLTGTYRWYNDIGRPLHIGSVRATLAVVATGAGVVVDVLHNGTSIYANPATRPLIPEGEVTSLATVPGAPLVPSGDYLTINVVSVGSTTPGSGLSITVVLS